MKKYVIVDRHNQPLRNEFEIEGLLILSEQEAWDLIIWAMEDSLSNAYRGLRIEPYHPWRHKPLNPKE